MNEAYYNYWGKAKPSMGNEAEYHLLPYHCLDVAAVGVEYLSRHHSLSKFFCDTLQCDTSDWLNWAAFWLALHDLGKFSEAFQSQQPYIFEVLHHRQPDPQKSYSERHDSLGQWIWNDRLAQKMTQNGLFGNTISSDLKFWMHAVTGHHGQPPKTTPLNGISDNYFSKKDMEAVSAFVDFVGQMFLAGNIGTIENGEKVSESLSWWFAGVAVLSDWLGSNTDYFSYKDEVLPLQDYWPQARTQAAKALDASGVIPVVIKKGLSFAKLFPSIAVPSPLQLWASCEPISASPQLFLLEDVTGAGKTEAALLLAYRLMEAGNSDGFFIALPSMATANAMYERTATLYTSLFESDANLVLAHGSRNLVEEFAATVLHASDSENDSHQTDESATARCTAWLADHNKRALLAQAGVGTIDQALLSVLHSKHQSLRLLGLFGKVLIVDEVHACDAYMQGILEVLLEFHARAGGSAILLSATLTMRMRQTLLKAYARGRGKPSPLLASQAYPLATVWNSDVPDILREIPVETRAAVTRKVNAVYVSEEQVVTENILAVLKAGKCACWVRNTVTDAMDAYAVMVDKVGKANITLFHARFALYDRLEKERTILHRFGKDSGHEQRKGQLVIATQVIEQSLDVDFDFLVSDLAPIDRLVQRAGRLRRHNRNADGNLSATSGALDERGEPLMMVYSPVWSPSPSEDWYKIFLPKAAYVYPDHAQLWLTAKCLQDGSFTMPQDARHLIEDVFGEDSVIPLGLQKTGITVKGQQMAEASQARNNALAYELGYRRGNVVDWWSDAKTPSRLGEQSVNVVLGRWECENIVPWIEGKYGWAYSTVRIAERLISQAVDAENPIYQRALETLPGKGKWSLLLPLKKSDQGDWVAQARTSKAGNNQGQTTVWRYCAEFGLQQLKENDSGEIS